MSMSEPRCHARQCTHLRMRRNETPGGPISDDFTFVCAAFPGPEGIPERILDGGDLHLVIAPDQVGRTVYTKHVGTWELLPAE